MKWIRRVLIAMVVLVCVVVGVTVFTALGSERPVGFRVTQATGPDGKPFVIAVWYPTDARPWPTTMIGPMLMSVAKEGAIAGHGLPLIVISHGNGGGPGGHADLAMALASAGYVVAAPMHTGDNFADQGALGSASFFNARSQQLRATVDHMLAAWPGHEHIDGRRLGAYGFSMGGFSVLTALGAQPDLRLIAPHCAKTPEFACKVLGHFKSPYMNAAAPKEGEAFAPDPRIKAAVLAAPGMGFTLAEHALDKVAAPIQLWNAEKDENVPNSGLLREVLKDKLEFHMAPGAGHLSFLAPCRGLLRPPEICSDPGEFDRQAFHAHMNANVIAFFDKTLKR
jgi:predicted dienelactone hydrolase